MPQEKRKSGSKDARPAKKGPTRSVVKASYKLCPYTDEKIWITTVTLSDIKKNEKTGECPSHKNRKELVRIPSFQEREKVYWETAHALEGKELECLPLFGGRQWSVSVTISEDANKKPPLFRWFRGDLELAVLPHLLDKIPDPPLLKGLQEYAEDEDPSALGNRQVSTLSQFAWEHNDEYGIPIVTTKWLSPNHQYFYTRKAAWSELERLADIQVTLQKHLMGIGARDQKLHPTFLTKPKILDIGQLRFLRDGLWVVGQEDAWQEDRRIELAKEEEHKRAVRQTFGKNPPQKEEFAKDIVVTQESLNPAAHEVSEAKLTLVSPSPPLDPEETQVCSVALGDGIAKEGDRKEVKPRPMSGLQMFLRCKRDTYRDDKQKQVDVIISLREAERELRGIWKALSKEEQHEWKERAREHFAESEIGAAQESQTAAHNETENPPQEEDFAKEIVVTQESLNPAAQEVSEAKLTLVSPSPPFDPEETQVCSVALGDGWGFGNMNNECETTNDESSASNSVELASSDKQRSGSECVSTRKDTAVSKSVAFEPGEESTSGNTEKTVPYNESVITSMETSASNMVTLASGDKMWSSSECVSTSEDIAASELMALAPGDESSPGDAEKAVSSTEYETASYEIPANNTVLLASGDKQYSRLECVNTREDIVASKLVALAPGNESSSVNTEKAVSITECATASHESLANNSVSLAPSDKSTSERGKKTVSNNEGVTTREEISANNSNNKDSAASDESGANSSALTIPVAGTVSNSGIADKTESNTHSLTTSTASSSAPPVKKRRKSLPCPMRRPSAQWRLSPEQINLCYIAAMNHFEMVMNTVKARALHSELQDGFDLLRERGRGRYDMELPIFDTDAFSFLTDLQGAAWMPIVRQVLGPDVVLIHKGVFLAMPGAEAQVYHQDGLHLTTKLQRPCHAVNVFIPLVDLHSRNGPTEFCLGSHILHHDGYDPNRLETPVVPAGTPVMFDYRLGHRGMSNSSSACRPIVYCTYAAAANGKEFRDSVNFSRKRYHKIGNLVEKPLSREERAANRRNRVSEEKDASEEQMNAFEEKVTVKAKEASEHVRTAGKGLGGTIDAIE